MFCCYDCNSFTEKNRLGPSCISGQRKTLEREKSKGGSFYQCTNPTKEINREKAMNLEKGFALDPIWGDFNAEIRGIISKKMGKVF